MIAPIPPFKITPRTVRLSSEDGVVIPVVMAVMAIALLVVAVAASSASFTSDSANTDRRVKRAVQSADAGVVAALYRMNKLDLSRQTLPCVQVSEGVLNLVGADLSIGWCPNVREDLGDGQSYDYRVKVSGAGAANGLADWTVVSTGRSCSAAGTCSTRRVAATASALTGTPLFQGNGVTSLLDLTLDNSSRINGNTATNGNITLANGARICPSPGSTSGQATPGPGKQIIYENNATVCSGVSTTPSTTPISLSPVNQGNAATVNDNGRLGCGSQLDRDVCTKPGSISWNPTTRRLSLSSNATLTLGGSVYSLCQLDLENNSQLIIPPKAPGSSVRIYIDSPENCSNNPSGVSVGGLTKSNGSEIVNQNADPGTLQVYVAGSTSDCTPMSASGVIPTPSRCAVTFQNNQPAALSLYAPSSAVTLDNNVTIDGAIAAKQIHMANGSLINWRSSLQNLTTTSVFPLFTRKAYRECSPTAPPATESPDAGC